MSLKEQIVDDVANVFLNEDDFAEPIIAVDEDGTEFPVLAIVFSDSDDEEQGTEGTFNVKMARVFISKIDVPDITRQWHLMIGGTRYAIDTIGEDDRIAATMMRVVQDTPKERAPDGFRRLRR